MAVLRQPLLRPFMQNGIDKGRNQTSLAILRGMFKVTRKTTHLVGMFGLYASQRREIHTKIILVYSDSVCISIVVQVLFMFVNCESIILHTGDWVVHTGDWVVHTGDWVLHTADWVMHTGDWVVHTCEWYVVFFKKVTPSNANTESLIFSTPKCSTKHMDVIGSQPRKVRAIVT